MARIGTWNIQNLFRHGSPDGPSTPEAYEAKVAALASSITVLAPDVLAVQEVGDPEALGDVAERIGGQWHIETAAPDSRGIRCGFLSRVPLTRVTGVSMFPPGLAPIQADDDGGTISRLGRAALSVRAEFADAGPVDLVCCHLKSKLLTFGENRFSTRDEGLRARVAAFAVYRRAAEAVTVRAHATKLLGGHGQERKVLVLGDLNDTPEAATTQILLGPPGSEIGTAGFDRPDQGDGQRLWNLAPLIPEANRYSRRYRGRNELIDHILASAAVAQSLKDGDIDVPAGPPPSIEDDPHELRDLPGSDHRPLVVTVT